MKILINALTLENAHLIPVLTNVKYWQSKNCQITFLGNADLQYKIIQADIIQGFEFIKIKSNKKISSHFDLIFQGLKRNLLALKEIKKIKNNYDVIYSRSSVLDLIIFPFILKQVDKDIKWLTVFDNAVTLNSTNSKLAWLFFHTSLILLKKADKIFVVSQDLKNFLLDKNFVPHKITITGNAIEKDLIRQSRPSEKYNIDSLFIGRINEAKGIYDMLETLQIIIKNYPYFQLAITGRGDKITEKQFKIKIKKMNLEYNIQFLDYITGQKKFDLIKSSKCFLFLSRTESFGIALLEAICCGIPALAYDLEPYKNIYQNNEIFVFKKGDYQSVAQKVLEIFDKKEFSNPRGELLLEKYGDWDKIAEIEYNALIKF